MALPKALVEQLETRQGLNLPHLAERRTPRLEPGDRLTRKEFERRYQTMPRTQKAELIEGIVFRETPVAKIRAEAEARINLVSGIKNFLPRFASPPRPYVQ